MPTKVHIRISDRSTGTVLAEGRRGWDITKFEGNFYIHARCIKGEFFKSNYVPGICPYKGLYVSLDLQLPERPALKSLAWLYWLPNPLFPFIWFRVAVPGGHPGLIVAMSETLHPDTHRLREVHGVGPLTYPDPGGQAAFSGQPRRRMFPRSAASPVCKFVHDFSPYASVWVPLDSSWMFPSTG